MTDSPRANPSAPGWSCPWCGATHYYDCYNIGPIEFLQAVMHDPTVSMYDRLYAADKLKGLADMHIYSDPDNVYACAPPEQHPSILN
jgi:hypothetical protein